MDIRSEWDDPRLNAAKTAWAQGQAPAAADAIRAAIEKARPTGDELARWRYLEGLARSRANDHVGAAQAFDAAAAVTSWPAASYARLASARSMATADRHPDAIARAQAVGEGLPISAAAWLVRGDSHIRIGQTPQALEAWKSYLGLKRRGPRWAELTLRLADAALADSTRTREALDLARTVLIEAPASNVESKAREIEARALARLPEDQRKSLATLSIDQRLAQAQGYADGGRKGDALRICNKLIEEFERDQKKSKANCDASVLKAQLIARGGKKADVADTWVEAVDRCENTKNQLIVALYQSARTTASAGRTQDAIRLYGRVEAEFPKHSYADDARLRAAKLLLVANDEPRFVDMLTKLPDSYPDGDMIEDGLFELAMLRVSKSDWTGAAAALDRSLTLRPIEKPHWIAGRAKYFRARVKGWGGAAADEKALLADVIRDYPFSYYTALAFTRLAATDAPAARSALAAAEQKAEQGLLVASWPAELQNATFARASELLRVGENAFAREEFQSLGLSAEKSADALWAVAMAYARAGATDSAFRVARARTADWSQHFAAGKWRSAWELAFPRAFRPLVEREASRSQIPTALAWGIMREESAFDPDAVSSANAYGLMQLIVPTAKHVGAALHLPSDAESLKRPEVNIALGCKLLGDLRTMFPTATVLAIPSYNAGAGATKRWLDAQGAIDFDLWVERIPYEETRLYTKRVIASVSTYAYLYDRDHYETQIKLPAQVKP